MATSMTKRPVEASGAFRSPTSRSCVGQFELHPDRCTSCAGPLDENSHGYRNVRRHRLGGSVCGERRIQAKRGTITASTRHLPPAKFRPDDQRTALAASRLLRTASAVWAAITPASASSTSPRRQSSPCLTTSSVPSAPPANKSGAMIMHSI